MPFVAIALSGCIAPVLSLVFPPARVPAGDGELSEAAKDRLVARPRSALVEATREALDAAVKSPGDVRLARRAAVMVRDVAGGHDPALAELQPTTERVLDQLISTQPCPGLVDAAATWIALGDPQRGGSAYVRAAHDCGNVDAAIAAVSPLRGAQRCNEAIAALRAAWPLVDRNDAHAIALLDGVTACSDAISLRRNLSFAPADVVDDYFALLEARRQEQAEQERRSELERARRAAQSQAAFASSQCESECNAAIASCDSSCAGSPSCNQRCSSIGHVCRSGCGGY
ncbi:MAG: hypothetical protein JWO36_4125 [Myxococcales bacterium]|nr:hypothetical protein [Myxococcales bacterium]